MVFHASTPGRTSVGSTNVLTSCPHCSGPGVSVSTSIDFAHYLRNRENASHKYCPIMPLWNSADDMLIPMRNSSSVFTRATISLCYHQYWNNFRLHRLLRLCLLIIALPNLNGAKWNRRRLGLKPSGRTLASITYILNDVPRPMICRDPNAAAGHRGSVIVLHDIQNDCSRAKKVRKALGTGRCHLHIRMFCDNPSKALQHFSYSPMELRFASISVPRRKLAQFSHPSE